MQAVAKVRVLNLLFSVRDGGSCTREEAKEGILFTVAAVVNLQECSSLTVA